MKNEKDPSLEEIVASLPKETIDGLKERLKDLDDLANRPAFQEGTVVTIKGKTIDLVKLDINFTLNEQQLDALDQIANLLINKHLDAFALRGYAGTGKSSIVKILLKWIQVHFGWSYSYEITAPTNRAKYVIEALSGKKSKTIHSLFGLMPNLELEKLDHRSLKFDIKKAPMLPKHLLIIDEGSMINDVLFDLIVEKSKNNGTIVLFIGDKAQLKPVKQPNVSKMFTIPGVELTKVERQKDGNPLGPVLLGIRNNILADAPAFSFEEDIINSKEEGLVFKDTSGKFLAAASEALTNVSLYGDYLHSRILAFQNTRVALYNNLIRGELGFTKEYHKGELLMAYANVGNNEYTEGLVNSCDYIIENDPVRSSRNIGDTDVEGFRVDLVSTDGMITINQFILAKDTPTDVLSEIAAQIEDLRFTALNHKDRRIKMESWKEYYAMKESFLSTVPLSLDGRVVVPKSIDMGYASTCHKAQGGTYKEIYIDYRDFQTCRDVETRNQLLYVGLSRCTNKAVMFV